MKGAILPAVVILAAVFAGCSGDTRNLSPLEAPEGPTSLQVPPFRIGQYLRVEIKSHHVYQMHHGDGPPQVVERDDHRFIETTISLGNKSHDRFFQPFDMVKVEQRTTDLDPDSERLSINRDSFVTAYDRATNEFVYREYGYFRNRTIFDCPLVGQACEIREVSIYENPRHYYPAWWDAETNMLLAGSVLKIGRPVSFSTTIPVEANRTLIRYHNFTAVREGMVRGERAFLVEESQEWVYVPPYPPKPDPPENPEDRRNSGPPPPGDPVFQTWYTASSPIPFHVEHRFPVFIEDKWYWYTMTASVVERQPGTEAVRLSVEKPDLTQRLPGATFIPAGEYEERGLEGSVAFPLSEARANADGNPILLDYQSFWTDHPNAKLLTATYHPSGDRQSWELIFGDGDAGLQVDARRTFLGDTGQSVHEERTQESFLGDFLEPLPDKDLNSLKFVRLADVLAGLTRATGLSDLTIKLSTHGYEFGGNETTLSLFSTVEEGSGWTSDRSFSMNLATGAIQSVNETEAMGRDEAIWWPFYSNFGFSCAESGQRFFDPGLVRLPSDCVLTDPSGRALEIPAAIRLR